jgi:aminoglycoside phosphotransferase (APT) family kinase protein
VAARFRLQDLPGDPPCIAKSGDPAALAREAAALERLAGAPWAPALVEHRPGRLVTTRLPGAPRPAAALTPGDARRLGAVLAALHVRGTSASGGLWWWARPAHDLAGYRRGRVRDAEAALAGTPGAGLAAAAEGPDPGDAPFRMAHGDLVLANVVWGPDGPGLVDWEFWRWGDPAEDLAYAIACNGLDAAQAAALLDGYGDPATAARVAGWVPVVAADAAGWYLAHGMGEDAARMLARACGPR